MMGRSNQDQEQLFYSFNLEAVVPDDHQVRAIAGVLDLSRLRTELAPYYSHTGRPSIDPELMIRMLILGYVFAIRSERALCREVQLNLAYRWFCGLGIEDKIPITPPSRAPAMSDFAIMMSFGWFSSAWFQAASRRVSFEGKALQSTRA